MVKLGTCFRLDKEDRDYIKNNAEALGIGKADFLRMLIRKYREDKPDWSSLNIRRILTKRYIKIPFAECHQEWTPIAVRERDHTLTTATPQELGFVAWLAWEEIFDRGRLEVFLEIIEKCGLWDSDIYNHRPWFLLEKSKALREFDYRPMPNKKNLLVVPAGPTSRFYFHILEGCMKEAGTSIAITCVSPSKEGRYEELNNIIETGIEYGYDAIAFCSNYPAESHNVVEKASRAKCPIFVFNSLTKIPSDGVVSYIGYDQEVACNELAKRVIATLGKATKDILVIKGLDDDFSELRTKGLVKGLKSDSKTNININEFRGNWTRKQTKERAEKSFSTDGIPRRCIALSDEMSLGYMDALISLPNSEIHGVQIYGVDGNRNMIRAMERGLTFGTLDVQPNFIGKKLVETAQAVILGSHVGKIINTGYHVRARAHLNHN